MLSVVRQHFIDRQVFRIETAFPFLEAVSARANKESHEPPIARMIAPSGAIVHWPEMDLYGRAADRLCRPYPGFRPRFFADVERITTDPRPAPANGTRLPAMAASIRRATAG